MALRESLESSGAYARSLQEHAAALEAQAGEATAYARSLEAELAKLRAAHEALGRGTSGGQG
jgi:hypothetical protein